MGRKKVRNIISYPSGRVQHIVLWMRDKNGNVIFTREQIKDIIIKHKGAWETYAFILHDNDVYDAEAVYQSQEYNRKAYSDRYKILADVAGLAKDETQPNGYVANAEIEAKARAFADELFPTIQEGQDKPAHWHIILTFTVNRCIDEIARWFKVEPYCVEVKKGRTAAGNAWSYLVHAHDPNKAPYEPCDVEASFNYVEDLEERLLKEAKHENYNVSAYDINDIVEMVALNGMTLREVQKELSYAVYARNKRLFLEARKDYLQQYAAMPGHREVYYVDSDGIDEDHGRGGLGKSLCAKALAKQIAINYGADPAKSVNDLQDYVFIAGDYKVLLQEYDGQPILLIDEINGTDLKKALKGINGVKALLSPFPERKSLDVKYGATVCVAQYIIINGIQSFEAFKRDLAGEMVIDGVKQASEEAVKEQIDRRMWGLLHLEEPKMDAILGQVKRVNSTYLSFWLNLGLFQNAPERETLQRIGRFRADLQRIALGTTGAAQAELEGKVLHPLMTYIEEAGKTHATSNKIDDPNAIPDDFSDIGEEIVYDDDELTKVHGTKVITPAPKYVQQTLPFVPTTEDEEDTIPFGGPEDKDALLESIRKRRERKQGNKTEK